MKEKEKSIETLRGIAIILMVAGHVVGHNHSTGMKVEDDSIFRYFYYVFQYLRMPLFTVISGYVYALRPFSPDSSIAKFLKGKAKRLIIPMITVGTIQYLFRIFVPGINKSEYIENIWRIYLFGFDQFWFLQAIFLIFTTIAFLELFKLIHTFRSWLILMGTSSIIYIITPSVTFNLFSFNGYIQLLPFFILGIGINKFWFHFFSKKYLWTCLFIFVFSFLIQQIQWFLPIIHSDSLFKMVVLAVGLSGISLLFYYRFYQAFLAKIGYYAFGIYLFHVFGSVAIRLQLGAILHNAAPVLVFFMSLMFGLGTSILMEYILMKNNITRRVFIGVSTHKRVIEVPRKMLRLKKRRTRA